MFFNHSTHPAMTFVKPRPVITRAAFRFFTAAVSSGPAEGPTSAADGPMNPTNRNADPTHSTPARMWKNRKISMNGAVANGIVRPSRLVRRQRVGAGSDVVVEPELPRVRTQPDLIELARALVLEARVDHVLSENHDIQEERVVGLQRVQDLLEGAGNLLHLCRLLGREIVQVLVDRVWRLDLVLHPVEPGHEHRAERQVRVARGTGRPELDA